MQSRSTIPTYSSNIGVHMRKLSWVSIVLAIILFAPTSVAHAEDEESSPDSLSWASQWGLVKKSHERGTTGPLSSVKWLIN